MSATEVGSESPAGELPRRWLVMGGSGAGKSTFSREMAEILELPVIHLDQSYWKPGWVQPTREEWRERVAQLAAGEQWVIDGNYSSTLRLRLPRTEAVVLLDLPTWQCFYGIWSRALRQRAKTRPDMADGCDERWPDPQFMWWVISYKWRSRPKVLRMIAAAPHVRLHHLRSRRAARAFLDGLSGKT